MSILALGRNQKKKSLQSKELEKTKRENSQSKIERKQKKEKKKKGKKIPDQGSKENKRNMQKGLWTRQHLNKYNVITK